MPRAILFLLIVALFALLFAERPAPTDANGNHLKDQSRLIGEAKHD